MSSSDRKIIHKNNKDIGVYSQSQNQQPSRFSEIHPIERVTEKNELRKILHTVSKLFKPNPEIIELDGHDNGKIISESFLNMADATDAVKIENKNAVCEKEIEITPLEDSSHMSSDDEIEIVDVVFFDSNHRRTVCSELEITSVNNPPQSSVENITNANYVQEVKNEKVICEKDVEVMSVHMLKKEPIRDFAVIDENSIIMEGISLSCSDTHAAPVSSSPQETAENCPEEQLIQETSVETIEIHEHETLDEDDSVMDDHIVDLTHGTGDYSHRVEYDFNHTPIQITGSFKEFHGGKKNNFTKGCKWAPDGSCIMTCSDDNKLRIFNLPSQLWNPSEWSDISELETALRISEGDLIYDYCWYPLMNSNDAATCCCISTSRKSTVHLWDAYTGELRCSYRSFNHLDELVTPHSVCFDSDGEKIFCGFHNVIRVFDVNRPGRLFEERQIYAYKSGQCGIISCFAFTSADKNISAAGSYQKSIGLYAEPNGENLCVLEGQANGITQLQFSPDGKYLYSGGRKDPEILCWDIRNLGTVLFTLRRTCETNQRIYFDISRCGNYVVSGNQNGVITFWDVTKEPKIINPDEFPVLVPLQFFLAHDDCVNGVSLHPSYPLLCSSSGQRKFPVLLDDESDGIFSSENEKQDNSLRLWWIGKLT